jgi:hypothetical protein
MSRIEGPIRNLTQWHQIHAEIFNNKDYIQKMIYKAGQGILTDVEGSVQLTS